MRTQKCLACGRLEKVSKTTCLGCGVEALVDADEPTDEPTDEQETAERLDRVRPSAPRVRCDAPIAKALDGVEKRAMILVTGERSAGKSTEIAVLSAALGWRTAWLDAEMNRERVRALFERTGAHVEHLGRVTRVGPPRVSDWREALKRAGRAQLVVVDSLHEWTASELERQELLTEAKALAERALVVVVAQWAREGHAFGSMRTEHRVAAVVVVEPERVTATKNWWAPLASAPRPPRES